MKRTAPLLACLALCPAMIEATSINFSGTETNDAVTNWSNSSIEKTQDLNGDDRFGHAGYYQIAPTDMVGVSYSEGILPDGNNLGINNDPLPTPYPTQFAPPSFIASNLAGAGGTLLNFDSFPAFKDSIGTTDLHQGVLWLDSENSTAGTIVDGITSISGKRNKAFSFTLSQAASFRMGVATDVMNISTYAPDYISVSNINTGEVFSTVLTRNDTPDMAFFDISGDVGDEFEVALWQTNANGSGENVAFALVTFDITPTLTYELSGGNIVLSWEQHIKRWILESSTDLGITPWVPVTGVTNNSVSVPMANDPKNFFRLRKDWSKDP